RDRRTSMLRGHARPAVDQCRNGNATHTNVNAANRWKETCFCANSSSRHDIRGRHARSRSSCTCRAYRALPRSDTFVAIEYFFKAPSDLAERLVIVVAPVLATGNTATAAIDRVKERGAKDIRFVCLIAAQQGVERVRGVHPDVRLWTAAIDDRLDERGFIVPGLGDAGDRAYGTK